MEFTVLPKFKLTLIPFKINSNKLFFIEPEPIKVTTNYTV